MNYQCPCCEYLMLSDNPPGTFEIFPVCHREDDDVQYNNPDIAGEANEVCLNEARNNFKVFGASSHRYTKNVRPPLPQEMP